MSKSKNHKHVHFPKVIYIMGTARSGTTILEILLANSPKILGAGEMTSFFEDGVIKNLPCSCGVLSTECGVWAKAVDNIEAHNYSAERAAFLNRKFDWHWGFLRGIASFFPSSDRSDYKLINNSVITHLAIDNSVTTVVDSSKYSARALNLYRQNPNSVFVICMTRSAGGLLNSFRKKNIGEQEPRSIFSAVIYIIVVSVCVRLSKWRLGERCLSVRYDDLANNPIHVLTTIEKWAGVDLNQTKDRLTTGEPLDVGHIITGNRLRKNKHVHFSPEADNKLQISKLDRFLAILLDGFQKILGVG